MTRTLFRGGKVFDVMGSAFDETPLRVLLMEAIRHGDRPEVKAWTERVIDEQARVGDAAGRNGGR